MGQAGYYKQVPRPNERTVVADAKRLLASWLDHPRFLAEHKGADLVVEYGTVRLVVELKWAADAATIGGAVNRVKAYATRPGRRSLPVVATSFMGDVGKRICAAAGTSWFDLSGNAHIVAPGLRVIIEGKPNQFARRGRPSSAFAPKSARIARRLLIDPHRSFRQQELARETGLDDGFTSKIVRRLEEDGLVERDQSGALHVQNPNLMLDAWAEVYAFEKHAIVRGHVTARSGEDLLRRLADALGRDKVRHAATGLGAAWLHTEFAGFRLVTFFVASRPDDGLLERVGFREESRGANVWLVIPDDVGVFDGAGDEQGISCVHPVQAYIDLLAQPERATEAAAELRSRLLYWGS
jgi:hypothetical protein